MVLHSKNNNSIFASSRLLLGMIFIFLLFGCSNHLEDDKKNLAVQIEMNISVFITSMRIFTNLNLFMIKTVLLLSGILKITRWRKLLIPLIGLE